MRFALHAVEFQRARVMSMTHTPDYQQDACRLHRLPCVYDCVRCLCQQKHELSTLMCVLKTTS